MKIPDEAVQAALDTWRDHEFDGTLEYQRMRNDLTAALTFLTGVKVDARQALDRFAEAAKNWGWQEDQGYNEGVIEEAKAEFDASYSALESLLSAQAPSPRAQALEEAAKIAEGNSRLFDHQAALAECRDCESGFHNGRLAAAAAIRSLSSQPVADGWLPIETAPKDGKIDIWATDNDGKGRRVTDCYYDRICDEWRTSAPALRLHCVKARYVTHWRPLPASPGASE